LRSPLPPTLLSNPLEPPNESAVASSATEVAAPPSDGFWSAVREAVAGSQRDYTTGSISRAVVLLAIPMVLEMSMESIFVVVDMFFVGRLGPYAQATVALTESLITIVYTLAFGLSIGVTAMVARRIGEKDPAGAAKAAAQALWLGLAIAAALGVIGAVFARPLMAAMGADAEVLEKGIGYTRVLLGGNASVFLLFLINAIFRGAGDAAIAMRALWLGNAFNILLGPLFIFGLGPFRNSASWAPLSRPPWGVR
jgi:Na+-driven multidrug efflux pump